MVNFLLKLFVKDYTEINKQVVRKRYGIFGGIFGVLSNIFLFAGKLVVGLLTANISIIADAINNLSDAGSSIVTIFGFKLANKPADKEHPFGHARMEYIASLVISFIIMFLGAQILMSSFNSIISPVPVISKLPELISLVVVSAVAILVKIYQAYLNRSLGKRINSITLMATAIDSRNDVIATSIIMIGTIISYFTKFNLDGYLAGLVSLFVIWSGLKIAIETSNLLLGEKPSDKVIEQLCACIKCHSEVMGIHDLQIHSYGPGHMYASIHVEVDASKSILDSHDVIDNIERELNEELGIIAVIHMDPVLVNDPETDNYRQVVKEVITKINDTISFHDFRVVNGPSHTNLIFDIVISHVARQTHQQIIKQIQIEVRKICPTVFCVIEVDDEYSNIAQ